MADNASAIADKATLSKHIAAVKAETLKHAGNSAFNPHLWVNRNVRDLETKLATTHPITKELADAILALKPGVPPKEVPQAQK